jgi:hypothetical protein
MRRTERAVDSESCQHFRPLCSSTPNVCAAWASPPILHGRDAVPRKPAATRGRLLHRHFLTQTDVDHLPAAGSACSGRLSGSRPASARCAPPQSAGCRCSRQRGRSPDRQHAVMYTSASSSWTSRTYAASPGSASSLTTRRSHMFGRRPLGVDRHARPTPAERPLPARPRGVIEPGLLPPAGG